MKRAAIYCRVSTSAQAETGTSLDTQLEACREYARLHGYAVTHEAQEDASGASLARPCLDTVRDMAQSGEVDALIVYDPDRLTRDLGHLMLLLEEVEAAGASLEFVNSPHERTPEGLMLLQMRGMFAQYERAKITDRLRRGKEHATRKGRIIQWMTPYGYTRNAEKQTLEVIEDEADTVRLIFSLMASGDHTLYSIAMRLRAMGIPKRDGHWWVGTVHRILTNETYTGAYHWNRTAKRGKRQVKRPRTEWLTVPVPAIIDRPLFERAQACIYRNASLSKRNMRNEYLLSGLLVCARCGKHYRSVCDRKPSGKEYRYYYCPRQGNAYEQAARTCDNARLRADDIEGEVWQAVTGYLIHGANLASGASVRPLEARQERIQAERRVQASERALQSLDREEGRMLEAYRQGAIEVEQLRRELEAIRERRQAVEGATSEARRSLAAPLPSPQALHAPERLRAAIRERRDTLPYKERRDTLLALETAIEVDGASIVIRTLPHEHTIELITRSVSGKVA